MRQDFLGHASQYQSLDSMMAVRCDEDDIATVLNRCIDDFTCRVVRKSKQVKETPSDNRKEIHSRKLR